MWYNHTAGGFVPQKLVLANKANWLLASQTAYLSIGYYQFFTEYPAWWHFT
jgi:hypothetical protein